MPFLAEADSTTRIEITPMENYVAYPGDTVQQFVDVSILEKMRQRSNCNYNLSRSPHFLAMGKRSYLIQEKQIGFIGALHSLNRQHIRTRR